MSLRQLQQRLGRKASLLKPYGPPNDVDLLPSLFGTVRAGRAGEQWPVCCGSPMSPVVQLNLGEAPFVPKELCDVALLALFVDANNAPKDGAPNGECWLLRTYETLEGLSRLEIPAEFERRRGRPIAYELLSHDFPDYEDVADLNLPDDVTDAWEDEFGAAEGSKLGGWPALLQSEIFW